METNEQYYDTINERYLMEYEAYYYFKKYHQSLRRIVRQAIWNKKILCNVILNHDERETHRLRFERLINKTIEINNKWRDLNFHYDESRINKIINYLTKIKNYEFKNSQYKRETIRHRK